MLTITVPGKELWNTQTQEFINVKERTLTLEHSLISVSKWESKWHKSFFSKEEKTDEENIDYIRCMTLTQNVDLRIYDCLTDDNIAEVNKYISDPMTATVIYEDNKNKTGRETITSELIYYWMIALNIPFECEKWPLNRLITLVRICDIKNAPSKKMSRAEATRRQAALNAARRQKYSKKG